jgi:hypothetical protein
MIDADPNKWGPFVPKIGATERIARLRSLRALSLVFCRGATELHEMLQLAEHDPHQFRLAQAELNKLPALPLRRLLASYADLAATQPKPNR